MRITLIAFTLVSIIMVLLFVLDPNPNNILVFHTRAVALATSLLVILIILIKKELR